ncbi:MAG: hypothetical protein JKY99_11130 [Rhizobiales bacterium]|nr:hypothetical protein [Hyphomicrobiales bacterium]
MRSLILLLLGLGLLVGLGYSILTGLGKLDPRTRVIEEIVDPAIFNTREDPISGS